AAGDRAQALRYYQAAHQALAGAREIDPELICVDENLARLTSDPLAREALAREAWTRLRATFGEANLGTLEGLSLYARLTETSSQALPLLTQVCSAYATLHPEMVDARIYCESYRAFLTEQQGDRDGALRIYEGIIASSRDSTEDDVLARTAL